jgi:hypothetical protein
VRGIKIQLSSWRIKENTFRFDTYPAPSGTARVPRVGECADERYAWPLFIRTDRVVSAFFNTNI